MLQKASRRARNGAGLGHGDARSRSSGRSGNGGLEPEQGMSLSLPCLSALVGQDAVRGAQSRLSGAAARSPRVRGVPAECPRSRGAPAREAKPTRTRPPEGSHCRNRDLPATARVRRLPSVRCSRTKPRALTLRTRRVPGSSPDPGQALLHLSRSMERADPAQAECSPLRVPQSAVGSPHTSAQHLRPQLAPLVPPVRRDRVTPWACRVPSGEQTRALPQEGSRTATKSTRGLRNTREAVVSEQTLTVFAVVQAHTRPPAVSWI